MRERNFALNSPSCPEEIFLSCAQAAGFKFVPFNSVSSFLSLDNGLYVAREVDCATAFYGKSVGQAELIKEVLLTLDKLNKLQYANEQALREIAEQTVSADARMDFCLFAVCKQRITKLSYIEVQGEHHRAPVYGEKGFLTTLFSDARKRLLVEDLVAVNSYKDYPSQLTRVSASVISKFKQGL